MQSYPLDAVDAVIGVVSCHLAVNCQRACVHPVGDVVLRRRCADEDVIEDHVDVDLGDEVLRMSQ
jgi:hypothetical protein